MHSIVFNEEALAYSSFSSMATFKKEASTERGMYEETSSSSMIAGINNKVSSSPNMIMNEEEASAMAGTEK